MEKKTTQSTNLTTNATTPSNTYNSGSGFFYERHSLVGVSPQSCTKLKQLLEANLLNSTTLQDSYISGEIKTDNIYGEEYGEVWRGYFVPSVSGDHKFRGIADTSFSVFLSTGVYGSTVSFVNATPIAYTNNWQSVTHYANYY